MTPGSRHKYLPNILLDLPNIHMPKSETPELLSPKVYMVLISLATWAYNLPCAGHVCTGTHTPGSQYGVAAPSITEVIQHLLFWGFEIFRFSGHMWMSGCSAPFPIWCAYPLVAQGVERRASPDWLDPPKPRVHSRKKGRNTKPRDPPVAYAGICWHMRLQQARHRAPNPTQPIPQATSKTWGAWA